MLFGKLRRELGPVLRELADRKECEIEEGKMMIDHVHMLVSIPPKYAVSEIVGYLKGKSAIHIARHYGGRGRNFSGYHFWARGYFASTIGVEDEVIREYIRNQEDEDNRSDQLRLFER